MSPLRKGEAGQRGNPGQFAKTRFVEAGDAVGFDSGLPGSAGHSPAASPGRREESRQMAARLSSVIGGSPRQLREAALHPHPLMRAQVADTPDVGAQMSDDGPAARVLAFVRR